jgi:hypothetical protein
MAEQRIGDNYLQALLENHDVGINPSHITVGNLLRDLVDARADLARLSAELEGARKAIETAYGELYELSPNFGSSLVLERVADAREVLRLARRVLTDTAEEG